MASVARTLSRAIPSSRRTLVTSARSAARPQFVSPLRQSARRGYASEGAPAPAPKKGGLIAAVALLGLAGAGYYLYSSDAFGEPGSFSTSKAGKSGAFKPTKEDYQKVYNDIAGNLDDNNYDDGSYGPVILRLGWHASGTYDAQTKTGGSNGATMRFAPESDHGANAGLKKARDHLEPIKQKYPWISYSDLWTLAAVAAVQEMGGPKVPWRPGRQDAEASACTPDGRLPDGAKEHDHLRAIFGRMGFNDQEIVALAGAHALGRCHTDRSGFDGPWTFSPTMLTNDYYTLLLNEKWEFKKWNGPKQLVDKATKSLMMLPADYALVKDKKFREYVKKYAADNDLFFKDFSDVVAKLFELGVPFPENQQPWTFNTLDES